MISNTLESEIYRLAKQKEIAIAEDRREWSAMEMEEIRKKICPELARKLTDVIDNIEVMRRRLADFKK